MERFGGALYGVNDNLRIVLSSLPPAVKRQTQEIRLRADRPVALTVRGKTLFVTKDGNTSSAPCGNLLIAEKRDIDESFRLICGSSVYAHAEELKSGFVIMKNGNRAGICGTLSEQGMMHNISSINIRIAREILGAADEVVKRYRSGGLLIAGPPGSGKTTLLRDFIRQISNSRLRRITVIDSRGEISGSLLGSSQNDLGSNTDILITGNKAAGIDIAVRTMFPEMAAFDEIGTPAELEGIKNGFNCGVDIVTTAHISSADDLIKRSVTYELLKSGAISLIVLLSAAIGEQMNFLNIEDLEL